MMELATGAGLLSGAGRLLAPVATPAALWTAATGAGQEPVVDAAPHESAVTQRDAVHEGDLDADPVKAAAKRESDRKDAAKRRALEEKVESGIVKLANGKFRVVVGATLDGKPWSLCETFETKAEAVTRKAEALTAIAIVHQISGKTTRRDRIALAALAVARVVQTGAHAAAPAGSSR